MDQALIEQARGLYYEFRTVAYIAKQTGLKEGQLKKLIYGPRGHMNPTIDSWFYERSLTNSEEFLELSARNRFLAHHFTAKALHETYEGMKAMDKRMIKRKIIGPDGKPQIIQERRYLTPQEMKYINDTVSTLDKLMRLSEGLPTDIIDLRNGETDPGPVTIPGGPASNIVLDMDKVARAIKLDPAMSKLIQGAVNGENVEGKVEVVEPASGGTDGSSTMEKRSDAGVGETKDVDGSDQRSEQFGGVSEVARNNQHEPDDDVGRVVVAVSEVIEPSPEVSAPSGRVRTIGEGIERDGHVESGETRRNKRTRKNSESERVEISGVGFSELHDEKRADEPLSSESFDSEDRGDGASISGDGERNEGSDWSESPAGGDPFADEYS